MKNKTFRCLWWLFAKISTEVMKKVNEPHGVVMGYKFQFLFLIRSLIHLCSQSN